VKQVGDLEAALLCFSENITREDLSPSEEGEGYAALMRKYGIGSAKELAAKLSVDEARITRRLRLARAPQIIRDGLTRGMKVPVEGEVEEGGPRRETRRLSMDAAIEFVKLYERHLTKKYAGVKPDGTPAADPKLAALVERCLTEGWSREKVRTFVDRTIAGKPVPVDDESTKKSAASADRGVAWTDGDRFIVALGLARAASSEEKGAILEQLRAALNTGSERA
jgi:ParB-like chromosome segregation protein Spo0J